MVSGFPLICNAPLRMQCPFSGFLKRSFPEKYYGGRERIEWLYNKFKKLSVKEECRFIDIYSSILPEWESITVDGIHLTTKGQKKIAGMINQKLGD